MTDKAIGKNITKYRKKAKLSQEKLAELSDISVGYLSKLERSIPENVSVIVLLRIANALDVSVDDLVYSESKHQQIKPKPTQRRLNNLLNSLDYETSEKLAGHLVETIKLLNNH